VCLIQKELTFMTESSTQPMKKSGDVEYPVVDLIQQRRSRRAYADTPVEQEKINSLFEAARWAPSSSNEQPWVYLYATKAQPELWNKFMIRCRMEIEFGPLKRLY
jgi:hypothetical protein